MNYTVRYFRMVVGFCGITLILAWTLILLNEIQGSVLASGAGAFFDESGNPSILIAHLTIILANAGLLYFVLRKVLSRYARQ